MTDNRTTELRVKLDTLGIEHTDVNYKRHMPITAWTVDDATPKQAIAATLGWIDEPDTIRNELADGGLIADELSAELESGRKIKNDEIL